MLFRSAAVMGGRTALVRETVRRHKGGRQIPVEVNAAPIVDRTGAVAAISIVFRDITERKHADERQRVLMAELAHRSRNIMAVIQSIVAQSLAGATDIEAAADAMIGRLHALAETNNVLTDEVFAGAPLAEIVARELNSFGGRAEVAGPRVLLNARVAQTMALVIHELATNAAKYGALSASAGRLRVSWRVETRDDAARLLFEWVESGGPPVPPPSHRGFGTQLITRVASTDFKCVPTLEYGEGLAYRFDAPLATLGRLEGETPVRSRLQAGVLRDFYDAWSSLKSGNGSLPALGKFNRERFASTGGLTLAEISRDGEVRFIETGRALTERVGRPLETAGLTDDDLQSWRAAYGSCAKTQTPCYEHLRFDFAAGEPLTFERLLLPFARGGKRVTHLAGMVVFSGRAGAE